MNVFSRITGWFQERSGRVSGKSDLQKNMENALQMKNAAGPQASIPEHQTPNEGMRDHSSHEDHIPAREGYFTPELKRTKVARSGDAS